MPQITTLDLSRAVPAPVLWLSKPNKTIIGKLKHFYNGSFQKRILDMNSLNFSIPLYIESEYDHTQIANPHATNLREHYLIKMVFNGDTYWFKINQLTKQSTSSGDEFLVGALSLESELRGRKIRNYTVESKTCTQALTYALTDTQWDISEVDPSFDLTYRDFDVSYKSAIEFIQTDLVEAFENSVVTFDTVNRTVSIVLESSLEQDLGFRIKFGKYMTSFSKDSQMDDIVTRMIGVGSDDLSISTISPTGDEHIDDFDYYLSPYEDTRSLSFDGVDDYVDLGNNLYDSDNIGTVEVLVKINQKPAASAAHTILCVANSADANRFISMQIFGVTSTDARIRIGHNYPTVSYAHGDTSLPVDEWIRLTWLSNGTAWKLLINGVEETLTISVGTNTGNWFSDISTGTTMYTLGTLKRSSGNSSYTNGLIDDIRIWNVARTEAEILANMNSTLTGSETGLVGYWKFNEGTGTTAYDTTLNRNNGTITGATWNIEKTTESNYMSDGLAQSLTTYNNLVDRLALVEDTAEAGTTSTSIVMTAHGLAVGEYIVNSSRGRETREVLTVPDANIITVASVTSQASGDTILKYPSGTFGKLLYELEDLQAELLVEETALTDLLAEKTIVLNTLAIQYGASTIDSYVNVAGITSTTVTRTLSGQSASDKYVALARIETTTGTTATVNSVSKSFTSDTWSVLSKETGLTSHSIAITTSGTDISVRTMIVKITDLEYSTASNEAAIIAKYSDDYQQVLIDAKQAEVDATNVLITAQDALITAFIATVSYATNFTVDELEELKLYTYVGEYRNENIIDSKDLYDLTLAELNKVNSPAILYKTGIANFLASVTEQKNWDKMDIHYTAKVIHDRLGIDVSVKITEIEYDFENTNINLTIASDKKILSRDQRVAKDIFDSISTTKKINAKLSDIQNQKNNFSTRNDRISTAPANPTVPTDFTAIEHIVNNNGSVDIYFTWEYTGTGDAYDIDGFYIYTYSSSTDNVYVFGSTASRQDFKPVKPTDRKYAIYGVSADNYYTFGVQAFRVVDQDIDSTGVLKSTIVQSRLISESPYQPETSISLNGIGVDAISKTAGTYIIADGSTSNNTKRADYVVPIGSTTAEDTINTAITALSASGGEIILLDGTYTVDGSIVVPSNVTIRGHGDSTIIKLKDAYNASIDLIINSDTVGGNINIHLFNFNIDGNKSNNTSGTSVGVYFNTVSFSTVQISAFNFRFCGIRLYQSENNKVASCLIQGNTGSGIILNLSYYNTVTGNTVQGCSQIGISLDTSDNNTITGNTIQGNGFAGIDSFTCNSNTVSGNTVQGSTSFGIDFTFSSKNNTITGNTIQGNGNGIEMYSDCDNNTITGNTIQGNTKHGINIYSSDSNTISGNTILENSQVTNITYDNIFLNVSSFNNIRGNTCRAGSLSNKPRYGINISNASCTSNIVANNDLSNGGVSGNLSDSSIDLNTGLNASTGNRDYVTTGTAQAGASTTVTLKSSSSAVDDIYNGFTIFITSGTGSGQNRIISGYVGSTKVATVSLAWTTNPDVTSVYEIR